MTPFHIILMQQSTATYTSEITHCLPLSNGMYTSAKATTPPVLVPTTQLKSSGIVLPVISVI